MLSTYRCDADLFDADRFPGIRWRTSENGLIDLLNPTAEEDGAVEAAAAKRRAPDSRRP